MKLIAIVVCLMFSQLQAQVLHLSLLDKSVIVKNDSLHFKYRFQNTSDLTLVLYNAKFGDFDMFGIDNIISANRKIGITPLPRLLIDIYNRENKLPKLIFQTLNHEISINIYNAGKYILLKPNESLEYDFTISLFHHGLITGEYKLQLVYFSNSYYESYFLNAKKKYNNLKNTLMFKDVVKSNKVQFYYVSKQKN